jgi:hypothetical protein
LTRAFPGPGDDGIVVTRSDPGCTEAYSGIFRQATVFIVGYDTDAERLFVRGDRTKALAYAKANRLTFDQVTARSLCHSVAMELLGS